MAKIDKIYKARDSRSSVKQTKKTTARHIIIKMPKTTQR